MEFQRDLVEYLVATRIVRRTFLPVEITGPVSLQLVGILCEPLNGSAPDVRPVTKSSLHDVSISTFFIYNVLSIDCMYLVSSQYSVTLSYYS